MISKKDGTVALKEYNLVINPALTKKDFLKSKEFSEICEKVIQYDNLHSNYWLKSQNMNNANNDQLGIILYFDPAGKLFSISLAILLGGGVSDWKDWTLEQEMEMKVIHDKWLLEILGEYPHKHNNLTQGVTYEYKWGSIYSGYDPRSGSSAITLNYKK